MYARNAATVRRLNVLQRILAPSPNLLQSGVQANLVRAQHVDGRVTIEYVSKTIRPARNPEYVPQKFRKCISLVMKSDDYLRKIKFVDLAPSVLQ